MQPSCIGAIICFLFCTFIVASQSETYLERAIQKVLFKTPFCAASTSVSWPFTPVSRKDSSFANTSTAETLCENLLHPVDRRRLACCPQHNGAALYLKNVKIEKGKMIFYTGSKGSSVSSEGDTPTLLPSRLPPITSVVRRKHLNYFMPVEHRRENFSTFACKSFYNGTLHVMGRLTTQNLYHAFNDNVLPLLTLVVLDAVLQRDMLLAPRAQLTGFHPPADPEQVPHLAALLDAALPQSFAVGGSADGMCFRRVAWGGGVKVVYQHLLGAVRRLSSDLLRELVLQAFHPPSPYQSIPFNTEHLRIQGTMKKEKRVAAKAKSSAVTSTSPSLTMVTDAGEIRPMNVVIYSRGTAGGGRSIGNETLLQDRLRSLGARAVICCDFAGVTVTQQLGYGVHADVIIGLHGAGLINNIYAPRGVITVELKTIYGYGLTLFATSTEARGGSFIELNIKDYHIWGAPGKSRNKPVDEPLVGRVVASIQHVVQKRELSVQVEGKHSGSAAAALSSLMETNFRNDLFQHLKIPGGRSGDLAIFPYPIEALMNAHNKSNIDSGTSASLYQQVSQVERNQLDFLLHLLGPEVTETRAQCAKLPISSYWAHTGEKNVHNKYCLSCSFPPHDERLLASGIQQVAVANRSASGTAIIGRTNTGRSNKQRNIGAVLAKLQH